MSNYLDTRDLYKRQCELQDELDDLKEAAEDARIQFEEADGDQSDAFSDVKREAFEELEDWLSDYGEELEALNDLENEVGSEWMHGETLILEGEFKQYAMKLAEDLHGNAIRDAGWPFDCIDWEQAAEGLKMDYSSVDYDGETYLFRAS